MDDRLLSIEDLSIEIDTSRGTINPVRHVDLAIHPGEMVGLVGESGSGKSVTAMSITRVLPKRATRVTSGKIRFDGTDLTAVSDRHLRKIRGNDISMIFQEPMTALNPVFTIGEQICEPLRQHRGMRKKAARSYAIDMLNLAGIRNPSQVARDYPHQLSGGMLQRAMIAMAMACEPRLLIADEPTTALDVTTQLQIIDLIAELQETHGTAVLLITHDLGVVAQTCENVAVMYQGEIQEFAAVEDIFHHPTADYTRHLLGFLPDFGTDIAHVVADETSAADSSPHASDVDTDAPATHASDRAREPLLRVTDLVKEFTTGRSRRHASTNRAVDSVSFNVERGKTLAIVGESGSGKSTVGRTLLRLHEPTSGTVMFDDMDLSSMPDDEVRKLRARIQIVFQDTFSSLDPRWTIGRTLAEPLKLHTEMTSDAIQDRIDEILKLVGLEEEHASRFPHEFSGGQRQRIGIARALLLDPDLVICDEPTSALDVSVQAQVLDLLKNLQARLGLTYIFISHDLSVVEMMADEVIVMSDGRIVERGSAQQVFHHPQHDYTKALLAAVPVPDPTVRIDREARKRILERGLAAGRRTTEDQPIEKAVAS